ncbi:hypothetical protein ACPOL_4401 [Acidisarcina polymorpha]|uniref:DUF2934 domain-containing protein n=1 Tax=Acidisarcina polymorpha TaxID=2211140 RepID=A0A2Z5G4B7_9BACT|nr:DUF2934 domain-containing protein [Acidisarcina polymorpha]AXC13674.1 hypothetical protein ACPOL_4401 [Acidisarcina polymorpha]
MAETVKKAKSPAKPRTAAAKKTELTEQLTAPAPVKSRSTSPKTKAVSEKPTAITGPTPAPNREQIAQLAHKFWTDRGRHHGSHEQDWFRAEQELRGMAS